MLKRIVLINGGLTGAEGNTAGVLSLFAKVLSELEMECEHIDLSRIANPLSLESQLRAADGFVFASGTYWQSWGSPLQRFFEATTPWEATDIWMGKPAASVITMHSVGGLEVLARLNLNLTMLGLLIPPHSCIVHSLVAQLARVSSDSDDIWDLQCLPIVCRNLVESVNGTHRYQAWRVDRDEGLPKLWLNER